MNCWKENHVNVQNVVFKKRIVRRIENANFRQLNLIYCMMFRETSYKNLLPQYFWKNFVKSCRSFSQNIFHFTEKKSVEPNFSTIVYAQCELWIDFTKYFSSELVFAYSTMLCISTYVEVLKVDFPFQYRSTDM